MGRINDDRCFVFDETVDDSALITSSPDALGFNIRVGWWRKRDIDSGPISIGWYKFVQSACCGDYLFVVTALGENCFK